MTTSGGLVHVGRGLHTAPMADTQENPNAFKHKLNHDVVDAVAAALRRAGDVDAKAFADDAKDGLLDLELKERVRHVIDALHNHLPDDAATAVDVVRRAALGLFDGGKPVEGWGNWPLIDFVGDKAADDVDAFDDGLEALRQMTHLWSAEFAIRPFYIADVERTLTTVAGWLDDDDEHVRRLVSEGCRPRLPWGMQLKAFRDDPQPVLALLERLKDDDAEYVRRSVANSLGDIAKDHADLVVEVCERWLQDASAERRWMVKHALRTQVKAGHAGALRVLGFRPDVDVVVEDLEVTPLDAKVGGALDIRFRLRSTSSRAEALAVDYEVHHVKANGSRSPKVFKLKTLDLDAGKSTKVRKKHSLKPVTTRTYYPGTHAIAIVVNGAVHARVDFELAT